MKTFLALFLNFGPCVRWGLKAPGVDADFTRNHMRRKRGKGAK